MTTFDTLTCGKGHPFDTANTYFLKRSNGKISRYCRACRRDYMREYMRSVRKRQSAGAA